MNILVSPYNKENHYFRSDSTLIRTVPEFYIPDFVESISATPILVFRVDLPGKVIDKKFANRYLGKFMYGVMLTPQMKESVHPDFQEYLKHSLDYSTIIPAIMTEKESLDKFLSEENPFTVEINGWERFRCTKNIPLDKVYEKFSRMTQFCSVRTGDYIAFELCEPIPVKVQEHIVAKTRTDKEEIRIDITLL